MVQLDYDEEMGLFAWDERLSGGRIRGPARHQEGGADGLLKPSEKSDWASQGPCRQQKNYRWITKRRE